MKFIVVLLLIAFLFSGLYAACVGSNTAGKLFDAMANASSKAETAKKPDQFPGGKRKTKSPAFDTNEP